MKSFVKENKVILIIILLLSLYLGAKALNPDGWDGWGFGSAQTLMSSRYWAKDGFAKNYFLFIPSPYGKLINYLDSQEFRTRKIQDINGALVRNRIYYTHYPPLYLFPYALIAKLDIENRAAYRIFSLLISLLALFLFHLFIKSVSNKAIATIASVYYGFSVTFLNYADSVSIQPWTILFTFLILYLSVLAWRNFDNHQKYKKYNLAIWVAYLVLSLSSYDATFYIFAYLILFDILIQKKFLWRRWLLFASAPILGFTLQIFQNAWYLGWNNMWRDIYVSYAGRALGSAKNFLLGLITPFVSMTGIKTFYFFKKTIVALGSASLIILILWKLRPRLNPVREKSQQATEVVPLGTAFSNGANLNPNFFRIIFVLAGAAIIQPFFINVTGLWPYQGVLTAPFWGLLIGSSSLFITKKIKQKISLERKEKKLFIVLAVIIIGLWTYQLSNTLAYIRDWPNNKPDQRVLEFSKAIKTILPDKEKAAFRILPKNPIWKNNFPIFNMEYFIGMLTIDFANTNDLLIDFWWLRNVSEYHFYSFVISENKSDIEKIRQELTAKNLKNISPVIEIQDQYLFTVGSK